MKSIEGLFISLCVTVIGGLVLLYLNKRRLFVVVPKLFPHSNLGGGAKTAEITIFNRGYRTEEDISVELDPALEYEQISSTRTTTRIESNVVKVERVAGGDDVTVLINVEGGQFDKRNIASITSKGCNGTVVDKIENVPPRFGDLFQVIIILLFLAFGCGFVGWQAKDFSGMTRAEKFIDDAKKLIDGGPSGELIVPQALAALGWRNIDAFVSSKLYEESTSKEFPIRIIESVLQRQVVTVKLAVKNDSLERLALNLSLNSAAGGDIGNRAPYGEHFAHDVVVFPGKTKEITLKVDLPTAIDPQIAWLSVSMKYGNGRTNDLYNIEKDFNFSSPK